jgi:hypothetical protein
VIYGLFLTFSLLQWTEHVTQLQSYKTMVKTRLGSNCMEDLNDWGVNTESHLMEKKTGAL